MDRMIRHMFRGCKSISGSNGPVRLVSRVQLFYILMRGTFENRTIAQSSSSMSKVFRIVGISGSLRKESWNTKLLKAFAAASKEPEFTHKELQFEIADWSK